MGIRKCIVSIMLIFCSIQPCFAQELSAGEIIDNIHKVYGEAQTYFDSGEVKSTYTEDGIEETDVRTFTTAFIRPDQFKFEFKYKMKLDDPEWQSYTVWQNGNKIVRRSSRKNGDESIESIGMAIATTTGVSRGSAFFISSLLLPYKVHGSKITDLQEMKVVESGDGVIQINGLHHGAPVSLWIDSQSYLIKKIETQRKSDNIEYTTLVVYNSEINVKMDDKRLEFVQ